MKLCERSKLVIVVVARLAVVEAVVFEVVLEAVLLQVALPRRRAGALEAAARLALRLLLRVAHLDQPEVALALVVGQHRHLDLRLDRLVRHDVEEVRLALLRLDASSRPAISSPRR